MKFAHFLLAGAAQLVLIAPAHAAYVRATYSGTIEQVGTGAPSGLNVGTPITFSAVYDLSKLVDHTASLAAALGGDYFASFITASLSDDPLASLSIKAGPVSFTKYDQINYGTPGSDCGPSCDLGAGDFPVVEYYYNTFLGVGNIFVNQQGYSLDADPIAYYLSGGGQGGGFGLDGPRTGPYQFFLGSGDADSPFAKGYAVGSIDFADVVITPVTEPAAWTLMLVGFGALGGSLRAASRRQAPA